MKTLIEIQSEVHKYQQDIRNSAAQIHPKLIHRLTENDLKDTSLYDNELQNKFIELEKQANEYNKIIWSMAKDYFNCIINDMIDVGIDVGYNDNGDEITNSKDFDYFVPSIHTKKLYNAIRHFQNYIQIKPFWKYDVSMHIKDTKSWVNIEHQNNPVTYINSALMAMSNVNALNLNEQFIIAVKAELQCGYKMHSKKINTTSVTELSDYVENVVEHKTLEELLKYPSGEYQMNKLNFKSDNIIVQVEKVEKNAD